jgi:hypothetical protein
MFSYSLPIGPTNSFEDRQRVPPPIPSQIQSDGQSEVRPWALGASSADQKGMISTFAKPGIIGNTFQYSRQPTQAELENQLMILEQQNKKRLEFARSGGRPPTRVERVEKMERTAKELDGALQHPEVRPHSLQDYQEQIMILKQQDKKRLEIARSGGRPPT